MTLEELRNKRQGVHGQVVYWSRKLAELDKQIKMAGSDQERRSSKNRGNTKSEQGKGS
jgi:hypothetical protein